MPNSFGFCLSFEKVIEIQVVDLVYLASHKVFDTVNYGKWKFESKKTEFDATIVKTSRGLAKAEATRHTLGKRSYRSEAKLLVGFLKDQSWVYFLIILRSWATEIFADTVWVLLSLHKQEEILRSWMSRWASEKAEGLN